ncbi:hypothetical protein AV530_002097 [Patagioenas fasciata monilis]|uniref:Uncharacterized protein n=1 Tax=Patagioenas fasciata monilis TaxID=372326 RepID=A0A1V4J7W9_PATFA|nr:hypothetical protein AV530_002097 [Patagioenas fasciata monilis]
MNKGRDEERDQHFQTDTLKIQKEDVQFLGLFCAAAASIPIPILCETATERAEEGTRDFYQDRKENLAMVLNRRRCVEFWGVERSTREQCWVQLAHHWFPVFWL